LHFFPEKKYGMNPTPSSKNKGKREKKGPKKDAPVYFQTIYVIHSASVCASTCLKKTRPIARLEILICLIILFFENQN